MDWKLINLEDPSLDLAKAAWIKAIKQIFWRRKSMDDWRIG
jgi:hypothetical protein